MKIRMMSVLALAMCLTIPASADETTTKKRGNRGASRSAANQLIKQLESVQLTDAQVEKIKEMAKKVDTEMNQIRESAKLTPELLKKRMEAQQSMKDSDKKGSEMVAAINKAAGLTEAQAEAMKKIMAVRQKLQKEVMAILTDEQKELLPERMTKPAGEKKANQGGKKRNKNKEAT
ncbi:hypothetical protein [Novipirellula artificiosorum]|uniref:LTXXQ motif protein n=1 Tax=Novipirellula artificiosorum TaxID=2528016 RepID=A0A5C6E6N5_9BACT|nr:hypothetical protein [Novipirellula artificiosorum]TWU42839.1 hypothetical protein Poly41_11400 [Novipirellula artificiosorum]